MTPESHPREQRDVLLQETLTLLSVISSYTQLLRRRQERDIRTDPATLMRMLTVIEQATAEVTLRVRLMEEWPSIAPDP